jgi:hypothetical protein
MMDVETVFETFDYNASITRTVTLEDFIVFSRLKVSKRLTLLTF